MGIFAVCNENITRKMKNRSEFWSSKTDSLRMPHNFHAHNHSWFICFCFQDSPTHKFDLEEQITWLSRGVDSGLWRNLTNIWGPLGKFTK